jgi:hypothetical protein
MKARVSRLVLTAAVAASACTSRPAPLPFPPLLQDSGLGSLSDEMETALRSLDEARASLASSPENAEAALDRVEQALHRTRYFYLPVLLARDGVDNAYHLAAAGDTTGAQDQLSVAEKTLLDLAQGGDDHVARELREPLDLLEEARVALATGAAQRADRLAELSHRLTLMLTKGRLIVP